MAIKRKTTRTKKRPQSEGGVNPLLVALGAGAGAAAGRKAATPLARRSVANRAASIAQSDIATYGTSGRSAGDITNRAAEQVADYEYSRMPRAPKGKLGNYRGMIEQRTGTAGEVAQAQKVSGLSRKDLQKYYNKSDARAEITSAKRSGRGADLLETAGTLRANRKQKRTAVKGGIAGGALATLAQLVAMELRKKK